MKITGLRGDDSDRRTLDVGGSLRIATCLAAGICLAVTAQALRAPQAPVMVEPGGRAVRWQQWLEANGPVAVVVWASWAPRADEVLRQQEALAAACREKGLGLVLVAVQEPLEESRTALGPGPGWLHDRHGSILKTYRVIRVPTLLLLAADGTVLGRLEPDPAAVAAWRDS